MAADKKYSEVLLELKNNYQEALAELDAQASQIKDRLTALDTLIDDPLLGSDILTILQSEADLLTSATPVSKAADTVEPKVEVKPKKTAPKTASNKKAATPKKPASTTKTKGTVKPKAEATPKKAAPKASPSASKKKPTAAKKSTLQAKAKKKKTSSTKASSRPMQWPYTDMFKVDAIGQILQDNAGNSVHVDDLIVQLYGELSGDDLKVERDKVYKTMHSGVQKNLWRKDPKKSMSYIFEDNSQAQSKESKPAQAKKSQKKT